jgi:ankyrin repeat protein
MKKSLVFVASSILLAVVGSYVVATDFPPSPLNEPSDDPLTVACRAGNLDDVRELVQSGISLNSADEAGLFPLLIVSHSGDLPLLYYLLDNGADVNFHPFLGPAIVVSRTEEIALLLLDHGADLDRRLKNQGGRTVANLLLFKAASNGWNVLLRQVYQRFNDPDQRDFYGRTPLSGAARYGHVETVRILLEWGATVDAADQHGLTPLMEACCAGQVSTAKVLITAGANLNHQHESGMTVLTLTVFRCWNPWPDFVIRDNMPILKLLVEAGAKIEKETLEKLQDTPCKAEYEYLTSEYELRSAASPNTSFQRTLTRGGCGPLNSDR